MMKLLKCSIVLMLGITLFGCAKVKEDAKQDPINVEPPKPQAVMVVTSNSEIPGLPDEKTGTWAEELVLPYIEFVKAGYDVTILAPFAGPIVYDPRSVVVNGKPEIEKFLKETELKAVALRDWMDANPDPEKTFDALFIPGGHGLIWDLADPNTAAGTDMQEFLSKHVAKGMPIAVVCHGAAALIPLQAADGTHYLSDKILTGFSAEEEKNIDLKYIKGIEKALMSSPLWVTGDPTASLENAIQKIAGGQYVQANDFREVKDIEKVGAFVYVSRGLVTGQNPESSLKTIQTYLDLIQSKVLLPNGMHFDLSNKDKGGAAEGKFWQDLFRSMDFFNKVLELGDPGNPKYNRLYTNEFNISPRSIVMKLGDASTFDDKTMYFVAAAVPGFDGDFNASMNSHVELVLKTFASKGFLTGLMVYSGDNNVFMVMNFNSDTDLKRAIAEGAEVVEDAKKFLKTYYFETLIDGSLGRTE